MRFQRLRSARLQSPGGKDAVAAACSEGAAGASAVSSCWVCPDVVHCSCHGEPLETSCADRANVFPRRNSVAHETTVLPSESPAMGNNLSLIRGLQLREPTVLEVPALETA